MNKYIKQLTIAMSVFAAVFCAGCSDNIDPLVTSLDFNRLFSPQNLEVSIRNQTSAQLNWKKVDNATSYTIEFFTGGNRDFTGTPVKQITGIVYGLLPYTVSGFEGETEYSVRVQAVGEGIDPSKWTDAAFKTGTEQIFLPIDPEEIQATQITLHWIPGETATEIILTPGDIRHTVTAAEIAAGAATITGLTGETTYEAKLMNGTKTRGKLTFSTLIDLGNATAINPGDDLVAILDAAGEGAEFVIFPGTYTIGSYAFTKSVKLSGYKSNEKPLIYGQVACGAAISIELKSIIFDGKTTETTYGQFFNVTSGCDISVLTLTDCEIRNYSNNFIYNNASGKFGAIRIADCYIHDVPGTGGDGIDFRGGTLGTLTVERTTFANGFRTFLRMQAAANVAFKYCTFYKISCLDDGNNHGLFRLSTAGSEFEVTNCLFVETGKVNPNAATVGNFCRQAGNMQDPSPTYSGNFYFNCGNLWAGLYTDPAQCAAREANPEFADPVNGDFHVSNLDIKDVAGDPRWW
ncbi:MAG: fibronectin type III domain-containing protein [Dysgonamonadaceae bacterium]|nr:fibronectin type III domain-containing protein [Dysgonamonadaceae bacterium]